MFTRTDRHRSRVGGAVTFASASTTKVIYGYAVIPWGNICEGVFTGAIRSRRANHGAAAPAGPERHRLSANTAITDIAVAVVIEIPPDYPGYRTGQNRRRRRWDVAYARFRAGGDEAVSPAAGVVHRGHRLQGVLAAL